MAITTTILGYVSAAAVATVAIVVAGLRRRGTTRRFVGRSASATRPGWRTPTEWFDSDPVLFVGGDAGSAADCGAGGDGGGGGCE